MLIKEIKTCFLNIILIMFYLSNIPKEELISPQEIADLILYLVTHRGNAVVDELHIRRTSSMPWG